MALAHPPSQRDDKRESILKEEKDSYHVEDTEPDKLGSSHNDAELLKVLRVQRRQQAEAFIDEMEELERQDGAAQSRWRFLELSFRNPKYFNWMMGVFASMGGMLFGLDQSLISGANLFMPDDLNFNERQVGFVNSSMPLGAVAGALLLSPANQFFGRRKAILFSIILYTIGAALEAGSINYPMMIISRLILGLGVGIETGTVPVYVAECVERQYRGNMVALYQFNIALGEVFGYVVAAIFIGVPGNWRYILGSSLLFSTLMFIGVLLLPESPRFQMHQSKVLEAYRTWKRIHGVESLDSRVEFYAMKLTADSEADALHGKRFIWLDFFRQVP